MERRMKVNKWKFIFLLIGLAAIALFSNSYFFPAEETNKVQRINGFNLVAPPQAFPIDSLQKIKAIGTNWVAIVPYAFCNAKTGEINFDHARQWWGEKPEGVIETIQMARSMGLKIMLKPHLWVGGQGWAGDLEFESDSLWHLFEEQYSLYIEAYIEIADSMNVEIFCIGTEIRKSTQSRNDFWLELILKCRKNYKGKLTYAANWDEYENIQFWDQLDLVGIDAYFPLSTEKKPTKEQLISAWLQPKEEIEKVSKKFNKPIIFTEYGYESIDYNTMGHWMLSKDSLNINFENQRIAFEALYESFNSEKWWQGGFIWKWHLHSFKNSNRSFKAYTPQSKPALKSIENEFNRHF
ncbi:glycoside hydrolase family 113 [Marivirga harenae]|uniref:glycoside hydrolase family 113 n=1 Tax=Marivirga harenae TaxID=2010992 RepID=UPI0026E053A3|nr:hypothetical protein [Marivirga harenae]WKV13941.1 hypothetical protein Q3Y49_08880 [Marivirga harenae]